MKYKILASLTFDSNFNSRGSIWKTQTLALVATTRYLTIGSPSPLQDMGLYLRHMTYTLKKLTLELYYYYYSKRFRLFNFLKFKFY